MTEQIDQEIEAIKTVLKALEPLAAEVRTSVLQYVFRRLQIVLSNDQREGIPGALPRPSSGTSTVQKVGGELQAAPVHIKDFKEFKNPRSAIEMAALVAYYLQNIAPPKERKDTITSKDLETYFKIAEFPGKPQFTLPNAKNAGYLDAVGNGEYKLNAVGHNLVVHSMPRGPDEKAVPVRRPSPKTRQSAKKR
jgi:hypothetical protein